MPEVLAMFLKSLRSANWKERHSAGSVLLDRALGRPTQPIVGADGGMVTFLHLVAVREVGEKVVAELALQRSGTLIDGQPKAVIEPPTAADDLGAPAPE